MIKRLARFVRAEDGAVTVDWVVLTAAVVGLGLLLLVPIGTAINSTNSQTAAVITAAQTTP
jgi:Flp pilus assembly pilin Flp